MPEYFAMAETGVGTALLWRGPFGTSEEAEDTARALLLSGRISDNPAKLFRFRNVYRYAFFGTREQRFREDGTVIKGKFDLDGTYLYDRELGGKRDIVSDADLAGIQSEATETLEDLCYGPLQEDFCDPCKDVFDYLNDPLQSGMDLSMGTVLVVVPDTVPPLNGFPSLVEVLPQEVEYFNNIPGFGDFYNWDGFRGLYGGFQGVPNFSNGADSGVDAGDLYYTVSGSHWGYEGMPVTLLWVPPFNIPLWPLNGIFPGPDALEQTVKTYLWKYVWNAELWAYSFATGQSARGASDDSESGYLPIYGGSQGGELPAEAFTLEGSFWEEGISKVYFKDFGDFTAESKGYKGWYMGVRFSIKPVYRVVDNDMSCIQEVEGPEKILTIGCRSDRAGYSDGTMFQDPFPVDVFDPLYEGDPFYNQVLELAEDREGPWANNRFVDLTDVHPVPPDPPDIPFGPPVQRKFLGYSGEGLPIPALLILNPNWVIQGFLENYKPFQGIPGYKYVIEFLRYITGKHSQYEVIGQDPVTGFDLYPVPVIVGADSSGFAVYGPAVYTNDTGSYYH